MIKFKDFTIKNLNDDTFDKGFYRWQLNKQIVYGNARVKFSDTLSGCGPVQMYGYTSMSLFNEKHVRVDFIKMFEYLIDNMIKCGNSTIVQEERIFARTPTAIHFIQGNVKEESNFHKTMLKIGFEPLKKYQNIAHGHTSKDTQIFYYLDITKFITNETIQNSDK